MNEEEGDLGLGITYMRRETRAYYIKEGKGAKKDSGSSN